MHIIDKMEVNKHILDDEKYKLLFTVEEVNKLVLLGVPFRDAYKKVGLDVEAGKFSYDAPIHHTHEGSIGNLCNEQISELKNQILSEFNFEKAKKAEKQLVS